MKPPRFRAELSAVDSARWQRIARVLDEALELPASELEDYLDRAGGTDQDLRQRVAQLLAADKRAEDFLARPAFEFVPEALASVREPARGGADPIVVKPGHRIGPWRIVRELGRGGMAVVYLAERADGGFDQRVAIKLMKGNLGLDEVLSRFVQERRIVARLDHPHIARLVDGGTTEGGLPYFAMEFVEGEPITDYCTRRGEELPSVLQLFQQACRAVAYAHQNLIVHRDLKPNNIFVSSHGEVKLLDFGIAKLLDPEHAASVSSRPRLTLDYAAPEQILGEPVTTATDVFALGVVLYELLTGQWPHGRRSSAPGEVSRAVIHAPALPPSLALAHAEAPARQVGWRKRIRGDLDAIVLKALSKSPSDRYPSVQTFLEDLERGRAARQARPQRRNHSGSTGSRHRAAIAAVVLVVTVIAVCGVLAAIQLGRVSRDRDEARAALARASSTSSLVLDILAAADSNTEPVSPTTTREILDARAERVRTEIDSPELGARLYAALARDYRDIGCVDCARAMYESAASAQRAAFGDTSPEVASSLTDLGTVLLELGRYAPAESALGAALDIQKQQLDALHPDLAVTVSALGNLYRATGRLAAADSLRDVLQAHTPR